MMRRKGIAGRCLINNRIIHFGWDVYKFPMDNIDKVAFSDSVAEKDAIFCKGFFEVGEPKDTFLKLDNFKKGFVMINGFNIGRYWEIGPQKTLYVPASLLKCGTNEIIIFESDGIKAECEVEFSDRPDLG